MNYNTMMNPNNGMMSVEALREQFPLPFRHWLKVISQQTTWPPTWTV